MMGDRMSIYIDVFLCFRMGIYLDVFARHYLSRHASSNVGRINHYLSRHVSSNTKIRDTYGFNKAFT
jgi:hypothetical protein